MPIFLSIMFDKLEFIGVLQIYIVVGAISSAPTDSTIDKPTDKSKFEA